MQGGTSMRFRAQQSYNATSDFAIASCLFVASLLMTTFSMMTIDCRFCDDSHVDDHSEMTTLLRTTLFMTNLLMCTLFFSMKCIKIREKHLEREQTLDD